MADQLKPSVPDYYYSGSRSEVASFIPENYSNVLEIGCARGNFRSNLKADCQYWGVEPTAENAHEAAKHLSVVLHGRYSDVENDLPDNHFDLIICNDVIEHMTDEDEFLLSIRKKLTSKGCLIGSVPNMRYVHALFELLVMKDWRYRDSGILDRTHLRFFTENSLKRTFIKNGFSIVQFHGIGSTSSKKPTPRVVLLNTVILGIRACTLGYYSDIKYMQFGFRVSIEPP